MKNAEWAAMYFAKAKKQEILSAEAAKVASAMCKLVDDLRGDDARLKELALEDLESARFTLKIFSEEFGK